MAEAHVWKLWNSTFLVKTQTHMLKYMEYIPLYTYIDHKFKPNVGIYSIHGAYWKSSPLLRRFFVVVGKPTEACTVLGHLYQTETPTAQ